MRDKGFTLIELLVVIAIIGILASIVLVALGGARKQARDARITAEMGQLRSKAELIYSDQDGYSSLDCPMAGDDEVDALCKDIDEMCTADPCDDNTTAGDEVTVHSATDEYCAYTPLNSGGYYCIDNTGVAEEYSSAPASCDGTTYTCE